jgi:hypothetical protein
VGKFPKDYPDIASLIRATLAAARRVSGLSGSGDFLLKSGEFRKDPLQWLKNHSF